MIHWILLSVDLPGRDIFIDEIIETYVNHECITDGKLDFKKITHYYSLQLTQNTGNWEI